MFNTWDELDDIVVKVGDKDKKFTKMSRKVSNPEEAKDIGKLRMAVKSAAKYLRNLEKIASSLKWVVRGLASSPVNVKEKYRDIEKFKNRLKQIDFALEPARNMSGRISDKYHIMGYSSTEQLCSERTYSEFLKLGKVIDRADYFLTMIEDEIGNIGGVVKEED